MQQNPFGGYGARRRGFEQLFDAMDRAMGDIASSSPFGGYLMAPIEYSSEICPWETPEQGTGSGGRRKARRGPQQQQPTGTTTGGGAPGATGAGGGGGGATSAGGGGGSAASGGGADTSVVPAEGMDLLASQLPQADQFRMIPIDVLEDNDKYTVMADAHWVPKENIKINVEGDNLLIHYEVKKENKLEKGNFVRQERSFAMSERSIRLPANVDKSKLNAKYENGVLKLELPKTAPSAPQKSNVPVL